MLTAEPEAYPGGAADVSSLVELSFWESVRDSQDPEQLRAYLEAYPDGRFATLARLRLDALTGGQGRTGDVGSAAAPTPPELTSVQQGREPKAVEVTSRPPGQAQPGDVFRDCDVCPQMVVIPSGRFEMGPRGAEAAGASRHPVTIGQPFAMGVYEVTVAEWDACLREGRCRPSPGPDERGALPVSNLSWDDAQDFVAWLGEKTGRKYRLPTEAEWEYAARAGTTTRYWWGDEKGAKRANCADCGNPSDGEGPSPVGSFEPNPFGLHDVHGNVWEWTADCWNPSYRGAPGDGSPWLRGDCLSRVLRGGAWVLGHEYMTSARRSRYDRDVRYYVHGLRVVGELPDPTGGIPSFEAAVLEAANKVFGNAPSSASGTVRPALVIDPVIDGLSGAQSEATHAMQGRIVELIRTDYPQFDVKDYTASAVDDTPYLVIGTFTGVNKERKTRGVREAFRICLALIDRESGTVASKAKVFALSAGVDITPTAFFRESPVWTSDPATQAYIKSCQATKPGDPIDPAYAERIRTAALIGQAIDAYEAGQYERSQDLFMAASSAEGGNQLRTYNGLYLTSWKLGDREQATAAFRVLVDHGLSGEGFALKLPFRSGSTALDTEAGEGAQADMWLRVIAAEVTRRNACLEIVGHRARVGPEALNRRLSIRRAEQLQQRLQAEAPDLSARIIASGKGSEANLLGSGTGDARDALDDRIELAAVACEPAD